MNTMKDGFNEINIVPMIDVILVLLICFMLVTPAINQGIEVELPESKQKEISLNENSDVFVITIEKNEKISFTHGEEINYVQNDNELLQKVNSYLKAKPDTKFFIKGDKNVSYGYIIKTMSLLKSTGIKNIGLIAKD